VKIHTTDTNQRGDMHFAEIHTTHITTGLSISSTGSPGSLNNIFIGVFKAVNPSVVNGTLGVSLTVNAEQVTFGNIMLEALNNGLAATNVENLVILNGLASQIRNEASSGGTAYAIVDGNGGHIFSRIADVYNGIALSGTTTRYNVQATATGTILGTYFTDTSNGSNLYTVGNVVTSKMTVSGRFVTTGGFSIGTRVVAGAIATGVLTLPAATTNNWTVDTEAAAAFDDLDTITGGLDGDIIFLSCVSDVRQVLVSATAGNIKLMGGGNRLLGNSIDILALQKVGSSWLEVGFQSTRGDVSCNATNLTLSTGGLTTDTAATFLPANSVIEAVTAYVTTTITTTTNWALGDAGLATRFSAASTGLSAGSTVIGLNHRDTAATTPGPVQAAAAALRVTCSGANPGAGAIRIFVFYKKYSAPSA
jgi:hypothetical protein